MYIYAAQTQKVSVFVTKLCGTCLETIVIIAVGINIWCQSKFSKTEHNILLINFAWTLFTLLDKIFQHGKNQSTYLQNPKIKSSCTANKYSNMKSESDNACADLVKIVATYVSVQLVDASIMKNCH